MRQLTLAALLFCTALPASAQENAKPNTLTPREAADGWLLLFDGKTTFGWNAEGELSVTDGWLTLGGKKESVATFNTALPDSSYSFEAYTTGKGTVQARYFHPKRIISTSVKPVQLRNKPVTYRVAPLGDGEATTKLRLEVPAGEKLFIRNIKLKFDGATPLFNGKDLTGWKVFDDGKRNQSKFTVKDGAINVVDGPGDLQTEGQYGDFVLQLECISHGKHLNSGIFFRCREGEYQNGYEAQIRNQFTPEPTQEYVIEQYDPKTHKLIGKETIKSPAVDYGTGAIYRRMPARSEASKDGEWFTLTVVANGNHFATWVNGIQQVDWTDHRPPTDNARTGFRREAGHLSIQGHDPTTNLSFRNLRLLELPSRPGAKAPGMK